MSTTVSPDKLSSEITKILKEYIDVTEDACAEGVIEAANEVVSALHEAKPAGSGVYGSWDAYNADWDRKKLKRGKKGEYTEVVYNKKHYQLAHLLENGHALPGGGRSRAFPHIAPVAEQAENTLLDTIKKHIKQS